ncbi:MAG: nucleotidyltransferase domain-containing protein, partial [bacterium]
PVAHVGLRLGFKIALAKFDIILYQWIVMTATLQQIQEYVQRLGEEFSPQRVILFGSYAYGQPTPDSDVDLLVIMPMEGNAVAKAVEIQLKLRPSFPLELLVRTPEKVRQRLEMGDGFMREILTNGKVLYEAARAHFVNI